MEQDELEKRLEWLDSERQKSNSLLLEFKDQIASLEEVVEKQKVKIILLETDLKNYSSITNRITQLDETTSKNKVEINKQIVDLEKKFSAQIKTLEKQQKDDANTANKKIAETQTILPAINEVKKNLQTRIDEENRIAQRIDAVEKVVSSKKDFEAQITQIQKRLTDDLQIEIKRANDLQVETSALRKRVEEERNRNDLNTESLRKLEIRQSELENTDIERRQNQSAFIEKLSLAQIERDTVWKEWQGRISEINHLGENFNSKLAELESTHNAIKKSQTELDDVNIRFDRRINELTEMHRLTEERFRQEWVSFKADDQKRWTNYLLTQDEQQQEGDRYQSKILDRITVLEDAVQESKDAIELITEEAEKQLKAYLSVLHELMESFEQTFAKK